MDPTPAAIFDPAGETIRQREELWPRFVIPALVLFLLDLLARRIRFVDRGITTKPASYGRFAVRSG